MGEDGRTLWGPRTSEPGQCLGQEGGCGAGEAPRWGWLLLVWQGNSAFLLILLLFSPQIKTLKLTISLFVVWQLLLHVTLYRSAQYSGLYSVCCSFLCAQGLDCQATWAGQLCLRACGSHRQRGYAGSTVGSVTAEPCCPLDAVSQLSPDSQEAVR